MSIEFWSMIFKGTGYLGAILVVIATIGTSIISDKQDSKKDEKIDILVQGNDKLISDIETYKKQLDSKQKQLDALNKKSIDFSLDIKDYFTYEGIRKIQNGSHIQTIVGGPEAQDFTKLLTLNREQQWPTLIQESSKTINREPRWLTPYVFRAIGYASLGDLARARTDLIYVKDRAGSSPDYRMALKMLDEVEQQLARQRK
ncbi:hypothetical protein [Pseudomonas juntendi]|uniref:hypothetical protein n=1 Tax=Pseudomonas juntendi TaxID=2666183 RepID=UPI001F467167|nr:hypothetical protein [Pseudomonas juntendi]MCO7058335.1 hypothetical protein [Pseudomonas juntendi]UJM10721.1 hypothetical protein L1P09_15380 [Pseudomonas juntendi]UXA40691.1 hypothetical protein KZA81_10135 [Pseudomonas juntendi]